MGVFATRSPHRPNPIGLSLVELMDVQNDRVIVSGADLVDGTPILDLKPYLPQYESLPDARGGWSTEAALPMIEVVYTDEAMQTLIEWSLRLGRSELREVIDATLRQDPRPLVYRGFESQKSPYRNKHAFRLYDGDIHFEFESPECVKVFAILF